MKRLTVMLIGLIFVSLNLYSQAGSINRFRLTEQAGADYILSLDFTAEQTDLPYNNYYAFYLVNTSNVELEFEVNYSTFGGMAFYYNDEYRGYSPCEIIVDANYDLVETDFYKNKDNYYDGYFLLKPNEKMRLFSYAFRLDRDKKYIPFLMGRAYVGINEKVLYADLKEDN